MLVILSSALLAHSQSAPVKEATGVVSGKVTIKGKAAPGVLIVIRSNNSSNFNPPPPAYKATTDINGEYRIANLPAGNYVVSTIAPAFVDASTAGALRTLIVNKGESIEHIDFALVRGGAITGKVVDADGRPLVEQEVRLFTVFPGLNADQNFSMTGTITDDRGVYRFYGLKAGGYKVSAGQSDRAGLGHRTIFYKQVFYPAASELDQAGVIDVSEGSETANIDITVGPSLTTYTASGRIVDSETGQPLAGVAYGIKRFVSQYSTSSMSNGVVSNSRGEFKLENLVPGKYAVQISTGRGSAWRADEVLFEIVDEDVSGLVVQTKRAASLSGVVVIEGGDDKNARNDLQRITLLAYSSIRDVRTSSGWSMIGRDGSFSMSGLAAGTAMFQIGNSERFRIVRVERNGAVQSGGFEIKEGEELSGFRVVLAYGNGTIRGAVEVANGPFPTGVRCFVSARVLGDEQVPASRPNTSAEADARGQFVLDGLFPGTYEISTVIWSTDGRTLFGEKKQQVVVTSGSVNDVRLSLDVNQKKP